MKTQQKQKKEKNEVKVRDLKSPTNASRLTMNTPQSRK
jgi:hypothetical protein